VKKWFTFNNLNTRKINTKDLINFCNSNNCKVWIIHKKMPIIYTFKFSDGTCHEFIPESAKMYSRLKNVSIIEGGPMNFNTSDIYAGYNPALGIDVIDKQHYNQILKEKGLFEVGNEFEEFNKLTPNLDNYFNESVFEDAGEKGARLTSEEIEALRCGETLHQDIDNEDKEKFEDIDINGDWI